MVGLLVQHRPEEGIDREHLALDDDLTVLELRAVDRLRCMRHAV